MDAKSYFGSKRDEARSLEAAHATKRFDSDMRVAGWRADVCDMILKSCIEGSTVDDQTIDIVEKQFADTINFLSGPAREKTAHICIAYVKGPAHKKTA